MKILCFGDSNTYGYDPRGCFGGRYDARERWVNILAERLGCSIVNAGENGREIPHRLWEIREFEQLISSEKPLDLVIIMLGTNDLLQGNPVADVADRMDNLLHQPYLERQRILLIGPPVLNLGAWVDSFELPEASQKLNVVFKGLAEGLDVDFVDAGEWNLPLAFDGVHLTQEGHRVMADNLTYYLNKEIELCCKQE